MGQKHKHAEVIKAWADGATIESFCREDQRWIALSSPFFWNEGEEYRIKPKLPAKAYPVTGMTSEDFSTVIRTTAYPYHEAIANAALRHAIDNDQLVPMAEVLTLARELRPRERAARDLAIAEEVKAATFNKVRSFDLSPGRPSYERIDIDLPAIIASVKD